MKVESLEGRQLQASLSSFFAGLFPTFTSTSTTNATDKQILKILRQAPDVTFPPYDISVRTGYSSDPGIVNVVSNPKVVIEGVAPPSSTIWLAYGPLGYFNNVTRADTAGNYTINAVLPSGTSQIRVFGEDLGLDYSKIETLKVTRADPIVAWNALAVRAFEYEKLTAEETTRDLAILHTAQYDAVANATFPNSTFAVKSVAQPGASPIEAANTAAAYVLSALFPDQAATFSTALATATAALPSNLATTNGAALGVNVAEKTIATRSNDGSTIVTASGYESNPNWSQVKPFAISNASEFRPGAPPTPGSQAFDQALAEVTAVGRSNSTTRTSDQTAAALFWADQVGNVTDPDHWNAIAEELAVSHKSSLFTNARTFALLNVALADSAIASSDSKVAYASVHPITAIQTTTDPTWTPLLPTPTTSSYVSEHAAFGVAAASVLGQTYGKSTPFTTTTNATLANPSRTFKNFAAAATEEANSRIYGGVNFRFDTTAGAGIGNSVGNAVLARFPKNP